MAPRVVRQDLLVPVSTEAAQPPTSIKLGAAYARVSGRPQDKMSIGTQNDECRAYAARNGIQIVGLFHDVASGLSTMRRPQFLEMVDFVLDKSKGITEVILFDLDRFTRRNRDFYIYTENLEAAGINLHSVAANQVYSRDSALSWQVSSRVNERNSRQTSFETIRGQRGAIRAGYYLGQVPPYGYRVFSLTVGGHEHPKLEPHPEHWPHLIKIWDMALNNHSPLTITQHLNDEGIPGPTGGKWTENTLRFILRNEHYTGYTFRGKRRSTRLPGRPEPRPVDYSEQQAHVAVISRDDFDRVHKLIAARGVTEGPTRSHSSPHIFSNLAKCGECKTSEEMHNLIVIRDPRYDPKLRCARKKSQGAKTCPKTNIPLPEFQAMIWHRLLNYIFTEDNARRMVQQAAEDSRKFLQEGEKRKKHFGKRLRQIDRDLENGNDIMLKYGARYEHLDSLMQKLSALGAEREEVTRQIEQIAEETEEARLFMADSEGIVSALLAFRTHTDTSEKQAVRELVETFIERIEVFNDHAEIYYHLTPQLVKTKEHPTKDTVIFTNVNADVEKTRYRRRW